MKIKVLILTIAFLMIDFTVSAGDITSPEYILKMTFIYKLANFVEWPAEVFESYSSPFTICILGKDPFGNTLNKLEKEYVKERKLSIKRIKDIKNMKRCHILFICPSEEEHLPKIVSQIKYLPILTIGDVEGFAQQGVMVNLIKKDDKISFEINIDATESSHLKISSQLLKLARIIR